MILSYHLHKVPVESALDSEWGPYSSVPKISDFYLLLHKSYKESTSGMGTEKDSLGTGDWFESALTSRMVKEVACLMHSTHQEGL